MIPPRGTPPKRGFRTRATFPLPGARPARKYVCFSVPNDGSRVQQESAAAEKLPAQENAQEGIERILVPDAIETNSTGKSTECGTLEFIGKVGWRALGSCTMVQRDGDWSYGGIRERGVAGRCRTKKLPVEHL